MPRQRQECRCGAVIEVEADDLDDVRDDVELWRTRHRCDPPDEQDRGRQGVGFAAAQIA